MVACYAELARVASHRALIPLVAGGVFYSLGSILNLLRWPDPWPGVFGPHEVFHLFVIAGSLAHYGLILKVVIPFGAAGAWPPVPARRTIEGDG